MKCRMIAIALAAAALVSMAAAQPPKKRVAVLDFDYASVRDRVSAIFGTDEDIGKGIADLIVENLVQSGKYSVIERKALDKILAEQNLSNSDRVDSSTAARLGRVLGVDAIVMGSITQFGRDDKSNAVSGGAVSRVTGRFGIGGVGRSEANAVVGISARMVNVETAEVLATAKGLGESNRKGTSLLGAGGGRIVGAGAVDMRSSNFANTIIGEAVNKAVVQLCGALDQQAASLPSRKVVIEGLVADAAGSELILNVGSKAGLKTGDKLLVRRKVREVREPASGKILRSVEDTVGEVVITEVDESSAVGKFTGASPAKVGDVVRNQ